MVHDEIPILDCSKISDSWEKIRSNEDFLEFTENLGKAMSGVGFVYLINHGIDSSIIDDMNEKSREFFQLPASVKAKYKKTDAVENIQGYTAAEEENVGEVSKIGKDRKEAWDTWGSDALDESKFPSEIKDFKKPYDALRVGLAELTKKLLLSFGLYLKLDDPEFLIKRHRAVDDWTIRSFNAIRSSYYFPLSPGEEVPEGAVRLMEHMDWGTITFLFQDMIGGLDAKKTDGSWIHVTPINDSIVLNAGLMLEMWSGGHFPATPHRVRFIKDGAHVVRQSIGYFIQPDGDSNCVPVVPEKPSWTPLYPKVDKQTHYEYFQDRVRNARSTKSY